MLGFAQLGKSAIGQLPGSTAKAYSLIAAQGSFSLTGQATTDLAARKLTAAQGSFTLTGNTVNPALLVPAAQGSFSLTG